eukprot:3711356-Pleurochrysis_carterae.AAC.8
MSTPARRRLMRDFKRMQFDPPEGVNGARPPFSDRVAGCLYPGYCWVLGSVHDHLAAMRARLNHRHAHVKISDRIA